ncbi:MAG: hypothetical protein ACREPS_03550 [Rhodanobacteraceae bacterium]
MTPSPSQDKLPPTEPRASRLARRALLAFVLTFIISRCVVFLIMSQRIPNLYFFLHGTHVHHLNYGIFLLAGVSAYLLFASPRGLRATRAAYVYGIAMALTFDEFGMWLHLGGSYWQRASVDAVIVIAALLGLLAFAPSWHAYGIHRRKTALAVLLAVIAFAAVSIDTGFRIGHVYGPHLEQLERQSSH